MELTGTIIFKMANVGSKSENLDPFLYVNKENCTPIWRKGDNPFENKGFDEYDGKKVTVSGEMGNTKFTVETIRLVEEDSKQNLAKDE